ncbi:MAG TPA: VOC family protein [Verrucomicrobiae bacterium]|nr:VOC family protein [Verrucomicrobiae bacterium]
MSEPEPVRSATPPPALRVVETALYFDGTEALRAAAAFYRDTLGLHLMSEGDRLVSVDAGGGTVLLLFHRGETAKGLRWPGGWIPPHDGSGPLHVAIGVAADQLEAWERWLAARGVEVESRVTWSRGGRSLYFRDPGGHSIELVTPGTWDNF